MRMRRHNADHESSHGIAEVGLTVNRPTSFDTSNADGKSINIQILNTGEIFVDNRVVDVRAVRANVERLKALTPEIGVLILADDAARTGVIMGVVDQVRLGGIANITFSTSG